MGNIVIVTLVHEECCQCGIVFGVTADFQQRRKNDHKNFHCPMGHAQFYSAKSEAEQLKDELARQKHRTEQAEEDARHQRDRVDAANRRVSAARGQVTRIKNRVGAGVCPCCNRTFKQLADHMMTQHPDYRPAAQGAS